ncbi:MAG: potassium channel family protein [Planctomycetota bacterium]
MDDRQTVRRRYLIDPAVSRPLLALGLVVVLGTAGYAWIEGWATWKSLFFTLVTLTTVGYGDYGLSEAGERFTAVLMICGIGTVSYSVSRVIQAAVRRNLEPERRMKKQANAMSGHHVVCGFGRLGRRVVERLGESGASFVVIDREPANVERARAEGHVALEGDATEDAVLEAAGLARAVSVAAVTSSDAVNAMICLTARAMATDVSIVARADDAGSAQKLRRAGAMRVVTPTSYGGDGVAEGMLRPNVAALMFGEDDSGGGAADALSFGQLMVDRRLSGKTIADAGAMHPGVVFVAVCPPGRSAELRPEEDRLLRLGDVLVIAGRGAEAVNRAAA